MQMLDMEKFAMLVFNRYFAKSLNALSGNMTGYISSGVTVLLSTTTCARIKKFMDGHHILTPDSNAPMEELWSLIN